MNVALINPKTNWTNTEKYNYGDINKVEGNTSLIFNYYDDIGFTIPVTSFITNRTLVDRDTVSSINRLENNIEALAIGIMYPPTWKSKVTWTRARGFTYNDANRWEYNYNNNNKKQENKL